MTNVLPGMKFGRLTVTSEAPRSRSGRRAFLCTCDCGRETVVEIQSLRSGNTTSCGCYQFEVARAVNTTHGMTGSRLWNTWRAMRERCLNPNSVSYPRYGGRGITLYAEWRSFSAFKEWALANGYRDGLTIDRIDNNGPYSPQNCRWATWDEQQNNRRNNHMLTIRGATKSVAQWSGPKPRSVRAF